MNSLFSFILVYCCAIKVGLYFITHYLFLLTGIDHLCHVCIPIYEKDVLERLNTILKLQIQSLQWKMSRKLCKT